MSAPLILIAASGLAREVLATLENQSRYRVIGIIDDEPSLHGTALDGVDVLGPLEVISEYDDAQLLICAGQGRTRAAIERRLSRLGIFDDRFATVIDSSVRVPSSCQIGAGSILLGNVVMTANVEVGRHVVSMPNVTLDPRRSARGFRYGLCRGRARRCCARGQGGLLGHELLRAREPDGRSARHARHGCMSNSRPALRRDLGRGACTSVRDGRLLQSHFPTTSK